MFNSFVSFLLDSFEGLSGIESDLVRLVIWRVVGFAHGHLSGQSLCVPFSELCVPRPVHFPSYGIENRCVSRSCHQGVQLSRFLSWYHPSIPGIDFMGA